MIRNQAAALSTREPILSRYERITFEKNLISQDGKPVATFVCPGHPLLDAVINIVLDGHRDVLKRGATLVAENDPTDQPRVLSYLEHAIQDARMEKSGQRRIVSRQLQFIEIDSAGSAVNAGPAPYLAYRAITELENDFLAKSEDFKIPSDVESSALSYAVNNLVPQHLKEIKERKEDLVARTIKAVKERLTKEIAYWDRRAEELKAQELAGKINARLNSGLARQRADELATRLEKRIAELEEERKVSPLPPVILGGALVIPQGFLNRLKGLRVESEAESRETKRIEELAMRTVMELERRLGFEPRDVHKDNLGYDLESAIPGTGKLRFIEVKGRAKGANVVCVTKNEILTALNKPDGFILAIVEVDGENATPFYVWRPFQREPDFGVTSVNYALRDLLAKASEP